MLDLKKKYHENYGIISGTKISMSTQEMFTYKYQFSSQSDDWLGIKWNCNTMIEQACLTTLRDRNNQTSTEETNCTKKKKYCVKPKQNKMKNTKTIKMNNKGTCICKAGKIYLHMLYYNLSVLVVNIYRNFFL
jgi:hypothetical protein